MIDLIATIETESETINLSARNCRSIETNLMDRSDMTLPYFGIFSNEASFDVLDFNGEFLNKIRSGRIKKGTSATVKIRNTIYKKEETISSLYISKLSYDNNNRIAEISLQDNLSEWQNIIITPVDYDPRESSHKNFRWAYEQLWLKTPSKYNMKPFSSLSNETKNQLENTYMVYPLIQEGNLWRAWTDFCNATSTHIFNTEEGQTTCEYNGGN